MEATIKTLEQVREQIRAKAEREMDELTRAIEILQAGGALIVNDSKSVALPESYSVADMVRIILTPPSMDGVFTIARLKEMCVEKWPGDKNKIRTGIYSAVNTLATNGEVDRHDLGFRKTTALKSVE